MPELQNYCQWVSQAEAARQLGVKPLTITRLIATGQLKGYAEPGRSLKVDRKSLAERVAINTMLAQQK